MHTCVCTHAHTRKFDTMLFYRKIKMRNIPSLCRECLNKSMEPEAAFTKAWLTLPKPGPRVTENNQP